jgi:OPT family oligopeptide transporter
MTSIQRTSAGSGVRLPAGTHLEGVPLRPIARRSEKAERPEDLVDHPDSTSTTALLETPNYFPDKSDEDAETNRRSVELGSNMIEGEDATAAMSKAPLLPRAAPGFGTGSYGAAAVGGSDESSDEYDDIRRRERRKKAPGLHMAASASGTLFMPSTDGATEDTTRSIRLRASASKLRRNTGMSASSENVSASKVFGTSDSDLPSGDTEEAVEDDEAADDEDPPDNSRYAQVRASVAATDDTTLSINTPRMWTLSMLFAILGSSTNLFFSLRYPSVAITPVIALLLVHPLGLIWDRLLKRRGDPDEVFVDGSLESRTPKSTDTASLDNEFDAGLGSLTTNRSRLRLWLAQGRWNEKEHSCVYISSNVSFGFAFATDVIVEQTQFYKQNVTITYQILLILSTQILGYTFAGLSRRFLVRPGGMIWPGTLMSAAMFTTLHKERNTIANGWRVSRWKFFFVVWITSFLFYFLPGLLMPALSYFSVLTWFAPKNVVVANLFGVASGLGLFPVTFDWAQIAYIGSPLLTPFWAAMNVVGGLVIVMWIIAPIAYYKNIFFSSYMPILSSSVFDNTGKLYDVSKILTSDFVFDTEAYHKYSRVYLPITYVLSYGLQFAALASLLTHTACWHGKDILKQWRRSLKEVEGESKAAYESVPNGEGSSSPNRRLDRSDSNIDDIMSQEDVHNRLMKRYKDAPLSWYLITCVSMTAVGIFVVE